MEEVATMNDNVVSIADARKGNSSSSGNGGGATPPTGMKAPSIHTEEHIMLNLFNNIADGHVNADGSKGYFSADDLADPGRAGTIAETLLAAIGISFKMENVLRDKGEKFKIPTRLPARLVAEALIQTGDFIRMATADGGSEVLMRQRTGRNKGIYVPITADQRKVSSEVAALVHNLAPMADIKTIAEVTRLICVDMRLTDYDPEAGYNSHLVFANNGVWDYDSRSFTEYDAPDFYDKYGKEIRLWKLAVDYDDNASTTPVITNPDGTPWDIDRQIWDIFDVKDTDDDGNPVVTDTEKVLYCRAIWEIMQFAVRGVSGGYAYWFANFGSAVGGSGGKSTITQLIRNLLGSRNVLNVPVEDFGEKHALASLPRAAAVISDETDGDTGEAIARVGAYKQAVTGEPIRIEPKFKDAYSFTWHGIMIQGMNNLPRIASAGGAFYRRLCILRFERNFALEGISNPLVKDVFIHDSCVLRNILWRICHMDLLHRLSPDVVSATEATKQSARTESSQVFAAMRDFEPLLKQWAQMANPKHNTLRIPAKLLYDAYREKWADANGYRHPVSFITFRTQLASWAVGSPDWHYHDKTMRVSTYSLKLQACSANTTTETPNPFLTVYPAYEWIRKEGWSSEIHITKKLTSSYRFVLEYTGD